MCDADVTAKVSDMCKNKESCKLDLANVGFTEADGQCPDVQRKYLTVDYECDAK